MRDSHRIDILKTTSKNLKVEDNYAFNSINQSMQHHESNKTLHSFHKTEKSGSHLRSSPKLTLQSFQQQCELSKQILDRVMKLEGQCKIQQWEFLQFNIFKAVISIFFITISVFGLFALKYSIWFRKITMFDVVTTENSATHIFIKGNDNKNEISKLMDPSSAPIFFYYKRLKYFISKNRKPMPVGYLFQNDFDNCFNPLRFQIGLNQPQVKIKRQLYGSNQHLAQFPIYPQYLIDVLTQPFFLLQYFFCFVFFMQGYAPFSIALLFFSFVTTTVNYIMLYVSYRKIKQIAQKVIQVKVIRNGKQIQLNSKELVPGDVYLPEEGQQVPADCIVGLGDIYVNEANLTGQSIPIGKFRLQDYSSTKKANTWIFEGSRILQRKAGKNCAIVINTGFQTLRGQIIRKILNRTVKDPDILRSTLIFVLEVVSVSLLVYLSTIRILLDSDIDRLFVFFKFIDFLASSAPPPLPILFNLAYSFALFRLRMKGIGGTQPQKVVEGARLKTFCFDKTGTLTESDVKIKKILKLEVTQIIGFKEVINQIRKEQNKTIWQAFAACHTVKLIQGKLLGDQIDKQMFLFAQADMQTSNDPNIRLVVKSKLDQTKKKNNQKLEILRINQFESKFQSMSVLVRDAISDKFYIYVKGSPEMLFQNCTSISRKLKKTMAYEKKVKSLSLNGYRTIAFGFKSIRAEQVSSYLKVERQEYVKNINILGLISFQNSLKHDSRLMIQELIRSNIHPKMITGDNLYIAVQCAKRAGILSSEDQIVILEGKNNTQFSQINSQNFPQASAQPRNRKFKGTILTQTFGPSGIINQFIQHEIFIDSKTTYFQGNYVFAVDNYFLTLNPKIQLSDKIRIFGRIPPQNKALIIKKYKQQHRQFIRMHHSKFVRFLKIKNQKIGMCGDGANDLIALRQADLSIGIHTTDASYGSSFTVKNMSDVCQVIRQSKGTLANMINLYQYYASIAFCFVICSMILAKQATFTSTAQLMLINFCAILLTPVFITLSQSSPSQSQYVPENNMMGLHNHLVFWGNSILPFLGVLASWLYFSHTDQFRSNPTPKATIATGFNSKNHTTTLVYILQLMITSANGFIIYQSQPWRLPIYRNFLLSILLIINFSISIIFAFLADHIQLFQFQPISHKNMAICLGILIGMLVPQNVSDLIINLQVLNRLMVEITRRQNFSGIIN